MKLIEIKARVLRAQDKLEQSQQELNLALSMLDSALLAHPSPSAQAQQELSLEGLVIYNSAGHGDFWAGRYYIFPEDGKFYTFQDEYDNEIETAYEGHYNRIFAKLFREEAKKRGASIVNVYHEVEDLHRFERVRMANVHYQSKKPAKAAFIDWHSNAWGVSPKGPSLKPRGLHLFTSTGKTYSDILAANWLKHLKERVNPELGVVWGGLREANFTTLAATAMVAVLIENNFFTNLEDVQILKDESYQKEVVQSLILALEEYVQA